MVKKTIFYCALLFNVSVTQAQLNVFACEPEWAALVNELAADRVEVFAATTAQQDPHHIEARPSLIAQMRRADLVVCTGAGLEAGWLPLLLRQSANSKVQPGQAGYIEAAMQVERLAVPAQVDRSLGDVHPQGNPHVHLDPRRLLQIASVLTERLSELDAENQLYYASRHADFRQRMQSAITGWQEHAHALKGTRLASYHKDWVYLFDWLGIELAVTLEPRPGIPPSAGYLAEVKRVASNKQLKMVVYAAYQDDQAARWLGREARIPVVKLPYTVGGSDRANDLFGLYTDTLEKLVNALP